MEERGKESKLKELWNEASESSRINAGTVLATPVVFLGYLVEYACDNIRDIFYSRIK